MTRTPLLIALAAVVGFGCTLSASGTLFGEAEIGLTSNTISFVDDLSVDLMLGYDLGEAIVWTESLVVLPATWVWQAFGATARVGGYGLTTNVLFGASTAEYLYAEMILGISIARIDASLHVAQLSDAVVGGPEGGWALRIEADAGPFDLVSTTEFGAQIDDENNDGITIFHAPTSQSRHYATDPRIAGVGFTGQQTRLAYLDFCCANRIEAALAITCNGFQDLRFTVAGLGTGIPWLFIDADLSFAVDQKKLTLSPGLQLGEAVCLDLIASLDTGGGRSVNGIEFHGAELLCTLGDVTVRDITLLDLSEYVITAESHGSRIEKLADAISNRHDFYPEYWQLLSIRYEREGCCGDSLSVLLNTYFERNSTNLFDIAFMHAEAVVPLARSLSFTLAAEFEHPSMRELVFGFSIAW